ncbi:hypothetical protein GQ55_6G048100 [Panicum hallii var. hallii]|uniref:No apical meristem-associated C-terminal domain-containing protein n=1 Tax=Panicum hallii var. hallii TaxID=1504633 RepID=A0A2T7D3Y2_9POAL|nr:hypothetical protein GQ55_6G048100 [Panicum hallii var. hallii]
MALARQVGVFIEHPPESALGVSLGGRDGKTPTDTIKKECSKFQALHEKVEHRHPSGIPYKKHILEAQTLYSSKAQKNKIFQFLHCWIKGGAEEEEGDGSGKGQTPDLAQANQEKRPIGRKPAKQRLRTGGDEGPYKEAIKELILDKKEEKKLKGERWEEERKIKEERWKETRMIHQQKISLEKKILMWEQEQRIMFCDLSTMDSDQKNYVLAMRAQIAA